LVVTASLTVTRECEFAAQFSIRVCSGATRKFAVSAG
jgi:hypothetical protein